MSKVVRGGQGLTELVVTVVGISEATGRIMVRDFTGREFEIGGRVRHKTGMPAAGEQWIIVKRNGAWAPDMMLNAPKVAVITGSRTGMHPVTEQMLDALAAQGIVIDQTTPSPSSGTPPDLKVSDPSVVLDPATDAPVLDESGNPIEVTDDPENPGNPIDTDEPTAPDTDSAPVPASTPTEPALPTIPKSQLSNVANVYVGSYNVLKDLSPNTIARDLNRLIDVSHVMSLGLQEFDGKGAALSGPNGKGWDWYKPTGPMMAGGTPVLWDADRLTVLDKGNPQIGAYGGAHSHRPPKYATWVRFKVKGSNVVYTHINCHLAPHVEGHGSRPGHPSTEPRYGPWVALHWVQLQNLRDVAQYHRKFGPVFITGDFNVNWVADSRERTKHFPFVHLRAAGFRASWEMASRPRYGTHGDRYIDYCWVGAPTWQVDVISNSIPTGFHSDHRPMVARMRVKDKK